MRILAALVVLALACPALSGCAERTEASAFGQAYREQLALQQVNPGPAPATPVTGLDGKRAQKVVETWRDPDSDSGPSFGEVLDSLMQQSK